MAQQAQAKPILYYSLEIAGREFLLVIRSDGTSQWDDHSQRRHLRHPEDQFLELAAFAGDARAFRQLQNECLEFAVDATVTPEILAKASAMAQRESKPSRYISQSILRGIEEIDDLLTNFFWKEINPLLGQPIRYSVP